MQFYIFDVFEERPLHTPPPQSHHLILGPVSSLTQAYRNKACNIQRNKGFLSMQRRSGPADQLRPPAGTEVTDTFCRPKNSKTLKVCQGKKTDRSCLWGRRQAGDVRLEKIFPKFKNTEDRAIALQTQL